MANLYREDIRNYSELAKASQTLERARTLLFDAQAALRNVRTQEALDLDGEIGQAYGIVAAATNQAAKLELDAEEYIIANVE